MAKIKSRYPFLSQKKREERKKMEDMRFQLAKMGMPINGTFLGNTGFGENGRLDPEKPTNMIQTQNGMSMIHEGEDVFQKPNGDLRILSAPQSQLQRFESRNRVPGFQAGGTLSIDPSTRPKPQETTPTPTLSIDPSTRPQPQSVTQTPTLSIDPSTRPQAQETRAAPITLSMAPQDLSTGVDPATPENTAKIDPGIRERAGLTTEPTVEPPDVAPSQFTPQFEQGLDRLEKFAEGRDPFSKMLRTAEETRFKGEETAARGALEQQISQAGLTSREALTERALQSRDLAAAERDIQAGIRSEESARAFAAAQQIPQVAMSGMNYEKDARKWGLDYAENKRANLVRESQWDKQFAETQEQNRIINDRLERAEQRNIDTVGYQSAWDNYQDLLANGHIEEARQAWDKMMANPEWGDFTSGLVAPNWEQKMDDYNDSQYGQLVNNVRDIINRSDGDDSSMEGVFEQTKGYIADYLSTDLGEEISEDDPRVRAEFEKEWKLGTETGVESAIDDWMDHYERLYPDYFDSAEERLAIEKTLSELTIGDGLIYDENTGRVTVDSSVVQKAWENPEFAHLFDVRTSTDSKSITDYLQAEGIPVGSTTYEDELLRRQSMKSARESYVAVQKAEDDPIMGMSDFINWFDTGMERDSDGNPVINGKKIGPEPELTPVDQAQVDIATNDLDAALATGNTTDINNAYEKLQAIEGYDAPSLEDIQNKYVQGQINELGSLVDIETVDGSEQITPKNRGALKIIAQNPNNYSEMYVSPGDFMSNLNKGDFINVGGKTYIYSGRMGETPNNYVFRYYDIDKNETVAVSLSKNITAEEWEKFGLPGTPGATPIARDKATIRVKDFFPNAQTVGEPKFVVEAPAEGTDIGIAPPGDEFTGPLAGGGGIV